MLELLATAANAAEPEAVANLWLIALAVGAIFVLLFLILFFRMNAFIALLLVSFGVALASPELAIQDIPDVIADGMGGTLGFVATIVGLGAVLGKILEVSGGAETLARTMLRKFGTTHATWALMITGFAVSIPIFLDVALVILAPIIYGLTRESGKPLLYYGVPLLAGLAVTHSFVPPTPGPVIVAGELNVGLGYVIVAGIITGIPAAILAGPIFGKYISKRITVGVPDFELEGVEDLKALEDKNLPSFGLIAGLISLPLLLMVLGSVAGVPYEAYQKEVAEYDELMALAGDPEAAAASGVTPSELENLVEPVFVSAISDDMTRFLMFIGHPFTALILTVLLAWWILGRMRGFSREDLMQMTTKALGPAGIIILITGAGGVFKQILTKAGITDSLEIMLQGWSIATPVVIAYGAAVFLRLAQGSATVAMVTSAAIVAGVLGITDAAPAIWNGVELTQWQLAVVVIAIAAGASIASHVNDSGFWLVSRFFGLSVKQTLASWTIVETIVSVVGFVLALILYPMLG